MIHARKVKGYGNTRSITLSYDTESAIDLIYKDPLKAQIEAHISDIESIVMSTIKRNGKPFTGIFKCPVISAHRDLYPFFFLLEN